MLRAGGVAGRRADSAVLLPYKGLVVKILVCRVAPELRTDPPVQELGEGLGEPVGERLYHDGVVVVVVSLEAKSRLISPESRCDGEESYVVFETRLLGATKSASERFGRPGGFCFCWRRKWRLGGPSRDPSV